MNRWILAIACTATLACSAEQGVPDTTAVLQSATARPSDSARLVDSIFPRGWQLKESVSPMDDSRTVVLSLRAVAPLTVVGSSIDPRLIIRCQEGETDTYIVTGLADRTVQLRIDSSRAKTEEWSPSSSGDALFSPSPVALARQLASGSRLLARFTPTGTAPQIAEFELTGLAAHLTRVSDACDWTGSRLPRTTDPKRIQQNQLALLPFARRFVVIENWSKETAFVDSVTSQFVSLGGVRLAMDRIDSTRMDDGALVVVIKRRR